MSLWRPPGGRTDEPAGPDAVLSVGVRGPATPADPSNGQFVLGPDGRAVAICWGPPRPRPARRHGPGHAERPAPAGNTAPGSAAATAAAAPAGLPAGGAAAKREPCCSRYSWALGGRYLDCRLAGHVTAFGGACLHESRGAHEPRQAETCRPQVSRSRSLGRSGVGQQFRQAELHLIAGNRVVPVRPLPHSDDETRFLEVAEDTTSLPVVQFQP